MGLHVNSPQRACFFLLACFNKPLILYLHSFYDVPPHPPAAPVAPEERVHSWVEQYMLAEVPGSIAQGRPADNYKPFSKHNSAAHVDTPMVSQ